VGAGAAAGGAAGAAAARGRGGAPRRTRPPADRSPLGAAAARDLQAARCAALLGALPRGLCTARGK
jgi:hypothetical protein